MNKFLLYELGYIVFCILFANLNAYLIKREKKIYHGLNGAIHIVAAVISAILFWWASAIIILCNARVFFDSLLSVFRGLPLDYVSQKPKSLVDKGEKWIFGNDGWTPKILYIVISLTINVIYFVIIKK